MVHTCVHMHTHTTAHTCPCTHITPIHDLVGKHTSDPIHSLHTHTHTHFYHLHEPHTVHTVTIYTSLVPMPGVRAHKQMTYLHHVHTYSTFTHCLPHLASTLPSTQTFPNRRPHSVCPAHTLTPSCSHPHVSPRGAPPTHCSLSWVPRGEDS